MHYRFATGVATVVLGLASFGASPTAAWAQAAAQENPYKDQGEVDLAQAAGKEADPQKKIEILKEWEQKYPDSKLKDTRAQMRAGAVLTQAQALLPIAQAAYGKTSPQATLDAGEKAAKTIADNIDVYFSDDNKNALKVKDADWATARRQFEDASHSVLGWTALVKKDYPTAETEFKKILTMKPDAAQISYWLGTSILGLKNIQRYSEAFYDIARSLAVTGANALPDAAKAQYDAYLKRAYVNYHGDETGLTDLKALAANAPLPPANYHIDSAAEIQQRQFASEEEFNKAHPDVGLWRQIRATLTGDTGDSYFASIKGSLIPPDNIGMFKGKVVSSDKDIVVNVDNAAGDVTLKFEKAINSKVIEAGTAIEFKGVLDSFTKQPYLLTLTVEDPKADIKGLPDNAFSAAPVRRPAPKKAAPKKK